MRDALELKRPPEDVLRLIVQSACPGDIGLAQICKGITAKDMGVDRFKICAWCWLGAIKAEKERAV